MGTYQFEEKPSLEHYGVKGMHWGHRKEGDSESDSSGSSKKTSKADEKFEKNAKSKDTLAGLHARATELYEKNDLDRIDSKAAYKNMDVGEDSDKSNALYGKYMEEHENAYLKQLNKAAAEHTNASGTRKYAITTKPDGTWGVTTTDVKHSDESFTVYPTYDTHGRITGLQSEIVDGLVHYGVKGMHWGVKKAHTGDLVKPIARLNRVAEGKGSLYDKARVTAETSGFRAPKLLKSGGLKNEAARRSALVTAHRDRLVNGQATALDLLKAYGTTNLISVARSVKD